MAVQRRCPEPGLLHHSDRGCTYTCDDYRTYLAARGITCSMSRRADCYDCEDDRGAVRPGLTLVTNDLVSLRCSVRPGGQHHPDVSGRVGSDPIGAWLARDWSQSCPLTFSRRVAITGAHPTLWCSLTP
jgi:hypothetical protein